MGGTETSTIEGNVVAPVVREERERHSTSQCTMGEIDRVLSLRRGRKKDGQVGKGKGGGDRSGYWEGFSSRAGAVTRGLTQIGGRKRREGDAHEWGERHHFLAEREVGRHEVDPWKGVAGVGGQR